MRDRVYKMRPIELELIIWYATRGDDHPMVKSQIQEWEKGVQTLIAQEMLQPVDLPGSPQSASDPALTDTGACRAMVNRICEIGYPRKVYQWPAEPEKGENNG